LTPAPLPPTSKVAEDGGGNGPDLGGPSRAGPEGLRA